MKADLHNHSTSSDGILTPSELLKYAKKKGVNIIAITDHDSVKALDEIKRNRLPIIIGVELSTYSKGENIHLLGYFIHNEIPSKMIEILDYYANKRKERAFEIIRKLKKYFNLELKYEDISKFADGAIGRVHVAKALEEKYRIPFNDVFDRYIGDSCLAYVKTENLVFKDAVDLLHQNNAIAVLAHPVYIQKNNLEDLIRQGIDGIEAYYPSNTATDEKRFLKLAKKYKLLITGGSDFHKYPENNDIKDLGYSTISNENLDLFLKKIEFEVKEEI